MSGLIFKDFYNQMLEQKIAYETSKATLDRVDVIWRKSISPFWRNVKPSEINQQMITAFINWHKQNRPGIQLVNVFKYLGNVMQVMVESGALDLAKKPKLELPKTEQLHHAKQKGRYITDAEFNSILSKTEGWFRLFLLIAYTTGMRKMEIAKLEISRLRNVNGRFIAVLNTDDTKTGLARDVPFPVILNSLIDEQLKLGSKYLFPMTCDLAKHIRPQSIDLPWIKAKKDAGIVGKMRLHDTRHSCASNLAKRNINPIVSVTMLGMSLVTFQKRYLKLNANDLIIATDSAVFNLEKK